MKNKNIIKHGFTLMELLAVVLIIGVLASIASPLYRNAVDKSRWARLISPARSIANAEEAIMISNGYYTVNKDELVVSLPTDSDLNYTLYTVANGDAANLVRVESSKLEDVRLARYYKENSDDSENVYCEAQQDNDRAKKICSKVLKGTEVSITDDGYKTYLIEGKMPEVCNWWSNTNNTCYSSEQERCEAHGMTYANSTCGCDGTAMMACAGATINEGGVCIGGVWSCNGATINSGGKCESQGSSYETCKEVTVNAGGECNANGNNGGCASAILEGGTCNAGTADGCGSVRINTGGVCNTEADNTGGCKFATINNGGTCNGSATGGCVGVTIESGGVCNGDGENSCQGYYHDFGMPGMAPFMQGVVKDGGVCNGNAAGSCQGPAGHEDVLVFQSGAVCNGNASGACGGTFQSGAKCYANVAGACQGDYSQGGCCEGAHCPSGTNC